MAALPWIYPVLYYATHPSLRYRHPIDPAIVILVAVGFTSILNRRNTPSAELPVSTSQA
jgi:hypothetical protein